LLGFVTLVLSPTGNINQNMTGLLQSVITIRAANWGRTSSEPSTPQQSPAPDFSQEPVFFSPSGQQISRVEAGYGWSLILVLQLEINLDSG